MESDRLSNTLSDGTRDGQQRGRPLHGRTSGPTRRSTKGQWTAEEDEILRMAVQRFKGKNWKKIAECFKDRTDVQCLHRWQKVLNPDLVKGPWSKEEDEIIIKMVDKYGPKKWSTIAQHLPGRIGKQCRERWHNHLNPNINKEAWTQEEELALIRAHQVYGNKWAELTKFLPGRTDNSIKNHWNSSVKKKLDMYLASGLLSQFQGPPFVSHVHQSAATSSSKVQQNSEDDSILKEKTEMEEASECSQGSTINRTAHPIVDCSVNEELGPFPCSEDYRPVFQEDTFGCEASENFLEHELLLDWGNFAGKHWEFNSNELPDMSLLDLGQESSDPFMPSLNGTDSHGTEPILPETSMALVPFTCRIDMVVSNNTPNLAADSDNILLYPETGHDGYLPSENMSTQINGPTDSLFQSNYQTLEDRNFVSQSFYMPSDMLENSFTQPCSIPTQLRFNDCQGMFSQNTIQGHYPSLDNVEQESNPPNTHEGFISDSIPCEDNSNEANGSPKREANDFFLAPSNNSQCDTSKGKDTVQTGEQDPGSISYNPPRFPSLDIPFFSCDLIQSGTDMHQDYSPLGIRQLMISSSMTPFKLWDSPSRDDSSPDAVLRSAAKTFTGTPSILKKRCRDLVSPLSEKRGEKKKETSNLRNDSRLGALFDECVDVKEFTVSSNPNTEEEFEVGCSDKENVGPGHTKGVKNERGKGEMENEHEFSGILLEHDMNDLIFISPDRFGIKNDRATGLSARALGNRYSKRLEAASKNGAIFSAAETSCFSVVCSPRLSNKKDVTNLVITNTSSLQSLSPSAKKVESSGNGAASENNSIFVDTPFRRSMESPSAWKSPWLFNTFVPGPRVDTEITIEDIGYLLSPGERSYDAIGLMKQLGEQTARAFADAQEVLGDETPDTIMKTQNPNSSADLQNLLSSQIMTERRTLDFSECGTPVKQTEKISSSSGHSSPSYFVSAEELQIERGI